MGKAKKNNSIAVRLFLASFAFILLCLAAGTIADAQDKFKGAVAWNLTVGILTILLTVFIKPSARGRSLTILVFIIIFWVTAFFSLLGTSTVKACGGEKEEGKSNSRYPAPPSPYDDKVKRRFKFKGGDEVLKGLFSGGLGVSEKCQNIGIALLVLDVVYIIILVIVCCTMPRNEGRKTMDAKAEAESEPLAAEEASKPAQEV